MKSAKVSAGLLMCRRRAVGWEFLLVHPGGPFYANRDDGVWTIPKGLVDPGEDLLVAARREFEEETGFSAASHVYFPLGTIKQKGGKLVHAWAFEGSCEPDALRSNTCSIEWPPRSGRTREIPEVDRAGFFAPELAKHKLLEAQRPLIDRALDTLRRSLE